MKSIRSRMVLILLVIVLVLCAIFGLGGNYLNKRSALTALETSLSELAVNTSSAVSSQIQSVKNIVFEAGCLTRLSNADNTAEEKGAILATKAEYYGFLDYNITDASGTGVIAEVPAEATAAVKAALKGETAITEPHKLETGEFVTYATAPIWKGGVADSEVVGAVYYVVPYNQISDTITAVSVGKTGSAYMINKYGLNIAHRDASKVGAENVLEMAAANPQLSALATMMQDGIAGNSGMGTYTFGGVTKIQAYAPLKNSDNWVVATYAEESEFLSGYYSAVNITVVCSVIAVIACFFLSIRFGNSITRPMRACTDRLALMAEGDFTTEVPTTRAKDETALLLTDLAITNERIKDTMTDVSSYMEKLSRGELDLVIDKEYPGEFDDMVKAVTALTDSIRPLMANIKTVSEQVLQGSTHVSNGAQALATGATEQASSVQQLAASIEVVSQEIAETAGNANDANDKVVRVSTEIVNSNTKMQDLMNAMADISDRSGEISKIIKAIEDIAFQTNILALNAAVEAARAGEAGKGFAVVADEVRNLASKSAEAAKNTTTMIEGCIIAVDKGTKIADDTAKSLLSVVGDAQAVSGLVSSISLAANEQATAIQQVSIGVDQISKVIQSNSATAEQSAATSEQLSRQAELLEELIMKFKL